MVEESRNTAATKGDPLDNPAENSPAIPATSSDDDPQVTRQHQGQHRGTGTGGDTPHCSTPDEK